MYVADASYSASLLLPDEQQDMSEETCKKALKKPFIVPYLWNYEIQNLLLINLRRKRINADLLRAIQNAIAHLDFEEDFTHKGATLTLAQEHTLSYYDASYLELALRKDCPLATYDKKLGAAAKKAGCAVFS